MMNDEELKAHRTAALFPEKTNEYRRGGFFKPHPKPDLAAPEVQAAVQSLNDEFLETLKPEAVPKLPVKPAGVPPANFLNAHNCIIDQLLIDPSITTKSLALKTGYTRGWLSRVMQSDAFQAKLAERSKALVDPIVMAKIEERLKGITNTALEILEEKLENTQSADLALSVLAVTTKSLGMGQKQPVVAVQNSFVVHVPPKVQSAQDWAAQHSGMGAGKPVHAGGSGATEAVLEQKFTEIATSEEAQDVLSTIALAEVEAKSAPAVEEAS